MAKKAFVSRSVTEKVGSYTDSERKGIGIRWGRGGRGRYSKSGKVGRR